MTLIDTLNTFITWDKVKTSRDEVLHVSKLVEIDNGCIELAKVNPGTYSPHIHDDTDSYIIFLEGEGIFSLGNKILDYNPNTNVYVPRGVVHGLEVRTLTLLFTIQKGKIKTDDWLDFRYV